jgi:hypothetical protein
LSIIPVDINKKILIPWEEFKFRIASEEEIEYWFYELATSGIGIITGEISGIMVLDFEKGADVSCLSLPETVTAKSGGDGMHYYFEYSANKQLSSQNRLLEKMDTRAENGYIIAPPSFHHSGTNYEWINDPYEFRFAKIPSWVFELYKKQGLNT